jgi:hypothetical protein
MSRDWKVFASSISRLLLGRESMTCNFLMTAVCISIHLASFQTGLWIRIKSILIGIQHFSAMQIRTHNITQIFFCVVIGNLNTFSVLLRGIQLTFVQRFQQLYFLIHYCCDERRQAFGSTTHVLASLKVKILYGNTIYTVEPQWVEHVWVEYQVAESLFHMLGTIRKGIISIGSATEPHVFMYGIYHTDFCKAVNWNPNNQNNPDYFIPGPDPTVFL